MKGSKSTDQSILNISQGEDLKRLVLPTISLKSASPMNAPTTDQQEPTKETLEDELTKSQEQLSKDKLEKNKFNLELLKTILSILMPISILYLTYTLNENANESKKALEYRSTMFHEKKKVYDLVGPILNDFYCYHLYIGHWKELSPKDLVDKKRIADKIMYVNRPFISNSLLDSYNDFIETVFQNFNGQGQDAKLRTNSFEHFKYYTGNKQAWIVGKWDNYFVYTDTAQASRDEQEAVSANYYTFLELVAKEVSPGDPPRDFNEDINRDKRNINMKDTTKFNY